MKKKFLAMLLLAVLLAMSMAQVVWARVGSPGDLQAEFNGVMFWYNLDGKITGCEEGSNSELVIPAEINGVKIKSLGGMVFDQSSNLSSILIPDGIISIDGRAFSGCSKLKNLIIPDSVTSIGWGAFQNCLELTEITLSKNITVIEQFTFERCDNLKNIDIPNGVIAIERYAFARCPGLESVNIPNTVTSIGEGAFVHCKSLADVTIPNSVRELGGAAFASCTGLTKISISEDITKIGEETFLNCRGLVNVIIPEKATAIGNRAFAGCASLKSISIPKNVLTISQDCFVDCDNLTEVYYGGTEAQWKQISIASGNDNLLAANIHYGSSPEQPSEPEKPEKPETPQPGGEDEIVGEIPANGFGVMVTTADGKPLSGVKVELANQFGMPEEVTDANGLVRFYTMPAQIDGNDKAWLNLSKEGYQSISTKGKVANGDLLTYVMYPNDGKTHIIAVSGSFMGDTADLARDYLYFKSNAEGTNAAADNSNVEYLKIDVTATGNAPINKYQLLQDGKVVFESNIAKMEIPVYTGTPSEPYIFTGAERVSKLKAGQKVYLRVVDENGTASPQVQLAIKVSQPTTYNNSSSGGPGSISIGKKLKVKLPRNIPMFGGQEFEFGLDMLPFQFQVFEDGKVRFAINPSKDLFEAGSVDGTDIKAWDNIGKSYSQAVRDMTLGRWSAGVKFGGTPQGFSAGNFKCSANVLGYGEGYVDDYGNIVGEIKAIVSLSEKYNFSYPTFILDVPVYVAVRQEGTASGSGHINIDYTNGQFHFADVGGELNLSFMLNPAVGLGVDNFISAEIGGRGTLSWLNRLADDYNKVDLVGDVYVEGKLFCLKKRVPFLDGTWTIYDSYAKKDKQQGQAMLASLYDEAGYEPIDRDYLNQPSPRAIAPEVVKANSYPNAMPSLVQVDETAYLFWLDDVASRADNDRTALVYATSRDMVNWSEPRQIVPETANSTADYMYDVCVEGGKIHIAMCKANQQFGTDC